MLLNRKVYLEFVREEASFRVDELRRKNRVVSHDLDRVEIRRLQKMHDDADRDLAEIDLADFHASVMSEEDFGS
jgi:hypothetical protein